MIPSCISLIGMPGSGKTTIGQILAAKLGYAFIDTDLLIESLYARSLQAITEIFPTELFRDIEGQMVEAIQARDCIIATGGSVIYRNNAVDHLKSLGPMIFLAPPLANIMERIALKPDRGISFAPGQTLSQLFEERMVLYRSAADLVCDSGDKTPDECADWILAGIQKMK